MDKLPQDPSIPKCHFGSQHDGQDAIYEGWYQVSEGRRIRITVCEDHKSELIGFQEE